MTDAACIARDVGLDPKNLRAALRGYLDGARPRMATQPAQNPQQVGSDPNFG